MPSESNAQSGLDLQHEDVLTLSEAAAYLRAPEEEVLRLAEQREIPAQQIGGEWRFLKRALGHWLTYGPRFCRDFREYPPWLLGHPMLEELLLVTEKRLLQRLAPEKPKRGSKHAISRHLTAFRDDGDLETVLSDLEARRKANNAATQE